MNKIFILYNLEIIQIWLSSLQISLLYKLNIENVSLIHTVCLMKIYLHFECVNGFFPLLNLELKYEN